MKREKIARYILLQDGVELGKGSSIQELAKIVGCSYQHLYLLYNTNSTFTYKKRPYTIVDKLAQ
jgi:hypothetical protein